jgi:hypothetical protein
VLFVVDLVWEFGEGVLNLFALSFFPEFVEDELLVLLLICLSRGAVRNASPDARRVRRDPARRQACAIP